MAFAKDTKRIENLDVASQVRMFEQYHRGQDPEWSGLQPEMHDLLLKLVANGSHTVRAFNWLKGVTQYRRQQNGGHVFVCKNDFYANNMLNHIGTTLQSIFKTNRIATAVDGKAIKYFEFDVAKEKENRAMSPELKAALDKVKNEPFVGNLTKDEAMKNIRELPEDDKHNYRMYVKNFYGWSI